MIDSNRLAGVYLLTPDTEGRGFDHVLGVVGEALHVGVRVVQYRDKTADIAERHERARRLVALAHGVGALLIVNDSVDVAISAGADGVHLGRDDEDAAKARSRLPDRLLGVSCYDEFTRAQLAINAGADAIAFGSMFASITKPAAVRAPLSLLTKARSNWPQARVVAIGGITTGNIEQIAAAGAHAAAVLDAVFGAESPMHAARSLVQRFEDGRLQYEKQRAAV
ncbi:MAG: thiamine phosphate synthase [Burkholderiaceae bacterium]